jgi:ABC-2 type transport system ATP-binding protein
MWCDNRADLQISESIEMSEYQINIANLKKTYASGITALKDISLKIPAGMFGLLGPNGAGKSTLMKILATLLEPDAGTVEMHGIDLIADTTATRRMLGYLPQEFGLYPTFTAVQMLSYLAALKGVSNKKERAALVDALLDKVNLSAAKNQKLGEYSGGMRQRFGIAQALIGQPKLLIVDEPTAGLDPEERNRFHNLLSEVATDEVVVILSTHIVSDVSQLCSQMAIIRQGEIIAQSAPSEAIKQMTDRVWETTVSREALTELKSRFTIISSQMFEGRVRLRVLSETTRPGEIFHTATPTLEDYYFHLVNQTMKAN